MNNKTVFFIASEDYEGVHIHAAASTKENAEIIAKGFENSYPVELNVDEFLEDAKKEIFRFEILLSRYAKLRCHQINLDRKESSPYFRENDSARILISAVNKKDAERQAKEISEEWRTGGYKPIERYLKRG